MNEHEAILAVDLGTGGPKVALVDLRGRVLAHEVATNELVLTADGGVEQDPDDWWRAIVECSRRLTAAGIVAPERVVAVCVGSQWMTTVPVDGDGRHLHNAISWMDTRGARYAREVAGGGLEVPGTGLNARRLRTWLQVTGGVPSLSGKDPVGHMLWLKHERPEVYEAAALLLEPVDYLNLRLTGIAAAAYDTIVGAWCTDNRDLTAVRYDERLLGWLGIDRGKLPDLRPTGAVLGPLTEAAAAELGLTTAAQVVMGVGDTAAAGIGSGAVRDYEAHLYIGTSSWLSCHVPFKRTDITSNITSLPSGIPGRYWVATEQDVAGKALLWLIDNVLYPDDALGTGPAPDDVLDRLNDLAATSPAGAGGVLFTPWLNGERTPVDDHRIRGMWWNLGLDTDRADLVRAVFEGVAHNSRWMLAAAEKFVRKERPGGFDHLNFVGGGALSPLWCQILADTLDRPIRAMAEPRYANARGAAFIAAVALGRLTWDEIPGLVEVAETYTPDASQRARADAAHDRFLALYKRNKSTMHKANDHG